MKGLGSRAPISVALVDDYDLVLLGVAHMLAGYEDRVEIVEIDANEAVAARTQRTTTC